MKRVNRRDCRSHGSLSFEKKSGVRHEDRRKQELMSEKTKMSQQAVKKARDMRLKGQSGEKRA